MKVKQEPRLDLVENDFLIGRVKGRQAGPTLIFMSGIHGNEPSGVNALEHMVHYLSGEKNILNGTIYALKGNPPALKQNVRFIDEDLNRLWSLPRVKAIKKGEITAESSEENMQKILCELIHSILKKEQGPFYFFDLHTTSCRTIPFLTVNDMRMNRVYAEQYPVPMILGIEEYLDGPVLSYINELGYVAFGFEAGQHVDPHAILNHQAFIRLTLAFTGVLDRSDLSTQHYFEHLRDACGGINQVYEIYFRHEIARKEVFEMMPGFENFTPIEKDVALATINGEIIKADKNSRLFMPLYQKQGNDGYFLIRKVPRWILRLSDWLRRARMDHLFVWLPGIKWSSPRKDALIVSRKVARFFTREIFHLFGYRNKKLDTNHIQMKNREAMAREREYRDEPWASNNKIPE